MKWLQEAEEEESSEEEEESDKDDVEIEYSDRISHTPLKPTIAQVEKPSDDDEIDVDIDAI